MRITNHTTVFDTADLDAESAFWAGLLSGKALTSDDWQEVTVEGMSRLAFQRAPDHVAPDWPHGAPQQIHLDLHVDDIREADEKAVGLGTRLLREASDLDAAEGCQVYADPAGHPFCLCWS